MKFELVEPPGEPGGSAAVAEPRDPAPADGTAVVREPDETFLRPVRERRARAVEGVRASLELLRARAAERSMAQAHRHAADVSDAEPGALFHVHRFAAGAPEAADAPGEENR